MIWEMVVAFAGVSMLFVLIPGADWAYAIAAGIGDRSIVPAVSGMLGGHLAATLVVATGVAAVVAGSPSVMTAVTVSGAVYLAWLGVSTLRHPPTPISAAVGVSGSWRQAAVKGLGVSALNPKVFLLFVAMLPQFTSPRASWPVGLQIIALGLVHVGCCSVVYFGVGSSARRVLRARPTATQRVSRVSGAVMIAIGLGLFVEQVVF